MFNVLEGFILILLPLRQEVIFQLIKEHYPQILFKLVKAVPSETYRNAGK